MKKIITRNATVDNKVDTKSEKIIQKIYKLVNVLVKNEKVEGNNISRTRIEINHQTSKIDILFDWEK